MVSISIMMMVMLVLFTLIKTACFAADILQRDADLDYSARSAMLVIKSDVLGAKKVSVINGGDQLRVESGSGIVSYYIQSHQLYRHGLVKLPVTEKAESVSFRMIRPGLLEVIFQAGQDDQSLLVQSAFSVRTEN